ncbi:Clp protease ClpP [Spongiibacter sp. KMU-166]|uniref:ATP-dependent Clp protease proteolytic subunit n=1 Tax=Spongiibacter thalassae TaxID=2721624 RepID=A0ABX1GET3_9GAMM|nr:ClpP-like prohead protease/major capsid protein fusion protein [Spongiibacter thalassae]NKI17431.1 Clp protease ClpP [Spongiibacter thalassae]
MKKPLLPVAALGTMMNSAIMASAAVRITEPLAKAGAETWYAMSAAANGALNISIYDEIGFWGINAADFKRTLDHYGDVSTINLSIHSPGGAVFEGLAIYNLLRNHPAKVNVHIDGLAASIASVIAMAGDTITIPENAFMMIHKPWVNSMGDAEKLREDADLLDKVETSLLSAYRSKTGLPDDEITAMIAAETWLTGAEAVEKGFADSLAEPLEAVANFQSTMLRLEDMFNSIPAGGGNQPKPKNTPAPAAPAAPAEPAPTPAPAAPAAQVPTVADFQAAETQRRTEVRAAFENFDYPELRDRCLDDMTCTVEQARAALLDEMGKGREPSRPSASQIHVGNGALVRDSIRNALSARVGVAEIESGNVYAGMTLIELARASLVDNGVGVASMTDRRILVANAFTHSTGDFSIALSDVAHKSMLRGYEEVEETFEKWTSKGILTDFREASRVDLSRFPSLRKVAEGAEFKYVTTSDRQEKILLLTYGELFSISRQAIINDDLSVFDRIPRMFGRAARRTIGDAVYAALISGPTMGDNKGLYHADHKNTSTPDALDVAALDGMKVKMGTQKEGGASLGIRPAYLLTPITRESTAKAILAAEFDPAYANDRVPNPIRNSMEVIGEARLDDDSPDKIYGVASPGMYDTIEVAYLDGNESPFLDQQGGFEVDGITHKVRIDCGVAPMSFRTIHRATITP